MPKLSVLLFILPLSFAHARPPTWLIFHSPEIQKEVATRSDPSNILAALTEPLSPESRAKIEQTLKESQAKEAALPPLDKSDYAALLLLVHGGEYADKAISLLNETERAQPGMFATAMNRATGLELGGRYLEALDALEQAQRLDPQPFAGTEWLQALIVRARMEIKQNPEWLKSNSVLGADFGNEEVPRWPRIPDRETWAKRARQALLLQLRDRLLIATAPDPVIADLLFDFSNLQFLSGSPATAEKVLELSMTFGPTQKIVAEKRLKRLQSHVSVGPLSSPTHLSFLILLFAIAIGGFVSIFLRRRKKASTPKKPA